MRLRAGLSIALLVIASVALPTVVVSTWSHSTIYDSGEFSKRMASVLDSGAVRHQLATRLTQELARAGNQQAVNFRPAFELAVEAAVDTDTFRSIFRTAIQRTHQSLLAGVWMKPRLWVGLISISLTQTRGGRLAMKAMVRPQSSGCSIFANWASFGGTGRDFRIGVATSPGEKQQARKPLTHSSMLKEWVSASTACLVVV